jgi:hypothetical protein
LKIKIQINKVDLELKDTSLNNDYRKKLDAKLQILKDELKYIYKQAYTNN